MEVGTPLECRRWRVKNMKFYSSKNFKEGWIVGDFEPTLFPSKEVEVAHLILKKGDKGDGHFHLISTEYNYLIKGKALLNGIILEKGDIFVYEPKEESHVEYLEDSELIVIKTPASKADKYYS